jgi:hypothetical protein
MSYTIIKKYKSLQIVRLDEPILGGYYVVRCTKEKKAKNGLTLDAAIEVFNKCIH